MYGEKMVEAKGGWEEQIESNLESAKIGERIRRLRRTKSMGLVDLGKRTGLSASFLSQLETGRVLPTIRHLARIALVFNKDLSYFFADARQSNFRISHGKSRSRIAISKKSGSIISESMSVLIPDRSLIPCIAEFPLCDADAAFHPEIFDGEEFAYVLDGVVTIVSGANEKVMEAGDVLWTHGSAAREYRCKAGDSAKVMIVTCPSNESGTRRMKSS
jgi:transcriptional regulator with XRE-family HTH domain